MNSRMTPYNDSMDYDLPLSTDELNASQLHENKVVNIISQLNPSNQLLEIEMRIRGYRQKNNTWEKIGAAEEPNELLVRNYIAYLSSLVNQSTTMGNLSERQAGRIMFLMSEYLTDDLDNNSEEYGLGTTIIYQKKVFDMRVNGFVTKEAKVFINNYMERTRIGYIIINTTFLVLTRALNGAEARRIWKALNINESLGGNSGGNESGMGRIMNALKFWK